MKHISPEVLVAYSLCPRKAFLLFFSEDQGIPHEYLLQLNELSLQIRSNYLKILEQENPGMMAVGNVDDLTTENNVVIGSILKYQDLVAESDILTKVRNSSSNAKDIYEPTIIVGTHQITKEQRLTLSFIGYLVGQLQKTLPLSGKIVGANGLVHKVRLESVDRTLMPILKALRRWRGNFSSELPPVILNRNCPTCQFKQQCLMQAEKEDNLSLLARVTPKKIQQFQKKGIFTVTQLSYIFKPRRSRKRPTKSPVSFKVELQALALRTGKIYIQELPTLIRRDVEIFLDLEGIPDQNTQYLIGVLINDHKILTYHYFWANSREEEQQIWREAFKKLNEYPEAPIYHYGSYEPRAIDEWAKNYNADYKTIKNRLINLNSCIYGKVYFPARSNNLKDLGKLVGASWSSPDASGLQSLVWRHQWEKNQMSEFQEMLITYNREDCEALWLLTEELSKIISSADEQVNIDFADQPKQHATALGNQIHDEFQSILKYAHTNYDKKRIRIRPQTNTLGTDGKKRGAPIGHLAYQRKLPSAAGINIQVESSKICPKHKGELLKKSEKTAEKFIINLKFTKNGCKKTVTKYFGAKAYCQKCRKNYLPPKIEELGSQLFGHAFQAWVIYQRIALRLPYRIISEEMENLFNERTSEGTLISFIKYFTKFYLETEKLSVQRILESPFIHADETTISIQGVDHYVWVFTDGKHVVFRMTETRESNIVHEFLTDYKGVLISDFYGGYDALPCKQQKCLVHLIRDLNNDLWKNPYNREYEAFVSEVKNLLATIFEAEEKYGLKKRHLSKFRKSVEKFYQEKIDNTSITCEIVAKYQKRFQRYKDNLFIFLELDGIPWHNNTAENAIRHLAVQRKISGSFFKTRAPQYLFLLGIGQTCKFQKKSLLKFLLSEEIDIDKFKAVKRLKISSPVGLSKN